MRGPPHISAGEHIGDCGGGGGGGGGGDSHDHLLWGILASMTSSPGTYLTISEIIPPLHRPVTNKSLNQVLCQFFTAKFHYDSVSGQYNS